MQLYCTHWMATALLLNLATSAFAEQPSVPPAEEATHIALVNIGGVEDSLFQRVVKYVEFNLSTKVALKDPIQAAGASSLEGEAEALESLVETNMFCLVGIILPEESVLRPFMQTFPDQRSGLVNARGLNPGDGDLEKFGRRLEKETIATIALLAGLKANPAPDCATYHYRNERGLDLKGRNLNPPQLMRFRKAATQARLHGYTASTTNVPPKAAVAPGPP